MIKPTCTKLSNLCDKVTFVLLCILMADCAVMGSGRAIMVGPLGLRMAIFGTLMVASVPLIIQQFPQLIKNRIIWLLAAFALWLVFETAVGIKNGNNRALLASDVKGFAYFVAILPAMCVLNTKERIHKLMKVIMYANALLALLALILLLLYNWAPTLYLEISLLDYDHHLSMFSVASSKVPRMFFKSTPYFIATCAFPIYFTITEKKTIRARLYPIIVGLSLFSILLSYTRSVYLATAVGAVFMLLSFLPVLKKSSRKQLSKVIGSSALACGLLIASCSFIFKDNFFKYAFDRIDIALQDGESTQATTSPSEDPSQATGTPDSTSPDATDPTQDELNQDFQKLTVESDKIRSETTAELNKHIRSSPIWGHGLGKALECRNGAVHEYIYQDIWMKTGIIGLALFFSPATVMLVMLIKKIRKKSEDSLLMTAWITVLLGFIVFSYFNPYMNAALGVLFYCCTIGVVCACYKETENI